MPFLLELMGACCRLRGCRSRPASLTSPTSQCRASRDEPMGAVDKRVGDRCPGGIVLPRVRGGTDLARWSGRPHVLADVDQDPGPEHGAACVASRRRSVDDRRSRGKVRPGTDQQAPSGACLVRLRGLRGLRVGRPPAPVGWHDDGGAGCDQVRHQCPFAREAESLVGGPAHTPVEGVRGRSQSSTRG